MSLVESLCVASVAFAAAGTALLFVMGFLLDLVVKTPKGFARLSNAMLWAYGLASLCTALALFLCVFFPEYR